MNKTISINIGGAIFNIEEDAFLILQSYLESIKLNFVGDPGASEIMADIEGRIAELFAQRMDERKNVVVKQDVEEVIAIMGQPEDYATSDGTKQQEPKNENTNTSHDRRRVYRDKDDAYVAGVCSGLSYYLGWDPMILRIGFVLLALLGGSAVLVYIIFWAVIPAAKTTAEKLKMRGETVNIDNIRRFVNQEAKTASDNINNAGAKIRSTLERGSGNRTDLGYFIKKAIGLILVFFSISMLIVFITGGFVANFQLFGAGGDLQKVNDLIFKDTGTIWMLVFGVILIVLIPLMGMLLTGVRLLIDSTKKVRVLNWAFLFLFVCGIVMIVMGSGNVIREFRRNGQITRKIEMDSVTTDTIVVNVNADTIFTGRGYGDEHEFFDLVELQQTRAIYGEPISFRVEEIDNNEKPYLIVEKLSNGYSLIDAGERASRIEYDYSVDGNVVTVDPLFTTPSSDPYRAQYINVTLYAPEGMHISFNKNIGFISRYDEHQETTVEVTEDGLE